MSADRMSGITYAAFDLEHDVGSSYLSGLGLHVDSVQGQIAMPDRYSLRMEATTTNRNAFVGVEVIGVADKAYMNLLGRWGETDPVTLPFDFSSLGLRLAEIMLAIQGPALLGEDLLGDVPAWRISGEADSGDFRGLLVNATPGEPIRLEVWVGMEDSLLHKARVGGRLFPEDTTDSVRVITITAVDVPVEIEPPL